MLPILRGLTKFDVLLLIYSIRLGIIGPNDVCYALLQTPLGRPIGQVCSVNLILY